MPWLAGAQHDAHQLVIEFLADLARELEAGVVAFHDHVKQNDGGVWVLAQQFETLDCRVGRIQGERSAAIYHVAQGQAGHGMNIWLIINDQDFPRVLLRPCLQGGLLPDVIGHPVVVTVHGGSHGSVFLF